MRSRTLQKLSLVSSVARIDENTARLFSTADVIRTGLGWVGTWNGAAMVIAAVIAGLACLTQLTANRGTPRNLADPQEILPAPSGDIVRIALPLDFDTPRMVTTNKPGRDDFFLISPEDASLAEKIWVYRENGITVGEQATRPKAQPWLVTRRSESFPNAWDLPSGLVDLSDDSSTASYRVSTKIAADAIVLVPGNLEELRPEVGLFAWWIGCGIVSSVICAAALRRLIKTLQFLRNRKLFADHLNGLLLQ